MMREEKHRMVAVQQAWRLTIQAGAGWKALERFQENEMDYIANMAEHIKRKYTELRKYLRLNY